MDEVVAHPNAERVAGKVVESTCSGETINNFDFLRCRWFINVILDLPVRHGRLKKDNFAEYKFEHHEATALLPPLIKLSDSFNISLIWDSVLLFLNSIIFDNLLKTDSS